MTQNQKSVWVACIHTKESYGRWAARGLITGTKCGKGWLIAAAG